MNVAVILAGGSGVRFGDCLPKQFLKLAGKSVIEHTIQVFQRHEEIDEIAVVCHPDYMDWVETLVNREQLTKVGKVLAGGKERSDSSMVAIRAYEKMKDVKLLFHDAVRPLLDRRIISDCLDALEKVNAVDVAIPSADTIIKTSDKFIVDIPDRNSLEAGQTPQGFSLNVIKNAYEIGLKDPDFKVTDDCGVVRKYLPSEPIFVVKGSPRNIKLTYEEDLFLADKLFQLKTKELVGELNLESLKGKVIVVFGGSSGIGLEMVELAKVHGATIYSFSRSQTQTDIADPIAVKEALRLVNEREGQIDYVVNSAAVLSKQPLMHLSDAEVDNLVGINYLGAVHVARSAFDYLKESAGSLLFFTSSSYTRGRMNYALYSSAKAGVVNLVQALSDEWDAFDIRVNCINPERTKTPMRVENFGIEDPSTLLTPKRVAQKALCVLLAKDITGEIVDVRREDIIS